MRARMPAYEINKTEGIYPRMAQIRAKDALGYN
jgi:hypothetical protein